MLFNHFLSLLPFVWNAQKYCTALTKNFVQVLSICCYRGTSLVVQWLRVCLPMQGTQAWSLIRELGGEGNGSTLQCSCLGNPRDGGDWWPAINGVAQSRTWLKRLSGSRELGFHILLYGTTKPTRCNYRAHTLRSLLGATGEKPAHHNQHLVQPINNVCLAAQLCPTLVQPHRLQPARLLCPWDFPGKNTGVGCHFLLQGIFPTRDWTQVSCICRWILYNMS